MMVTFASLNFHGASRSRFRRLFAFGDAYFGRCCFILSLCPLYIPASVRVLPSEATIIYNGTRGQRGGVVWLRS